MKYLLNWKHPLLSMSKRFFIFITLMFAGGVVLSTYKTQLNMELGVWLFYQYLEILLAAFAVLFMMAQASRLFSVELRSEDVVGRNKLFRKVSIPYTEMVGEKCSSSIAWSFEPTASNVFTPLLIWTVSKIFRIKSTPD